MKRLNSEDFIELCKTIHSYDYSKTLYKNMRVKIEVICDKHDSFFILPYNHTTLKQGCKECALEKHKLVEITNLDLLIFNNIHNNKYLYKDMSVDDGIINIECIRHGFFKQSIYNHKKGHGCKECALENRKINTKDILREKRRIYHKKRLETDILYKCKIYIKNTIRTSLKSNGYTKKSRTYEILGCTNEYFKVYLESQFLPGMNWDNRKYWHIDHIIPSDFAINEEELLKLNNYKNLRPLWVGMNLEKSNNIIIKTDLYHDILKQRELNTI
jgi:hypothetical protein